MSEKTEYAVLRFLDTNGYSHMISDYVKGETLVQYLAKGQKITKKKMLEWIIAFIRQAEQFYKWENGEVYGWFMPYAVIFTESGEVLLLEPGDPANREVRSIMEKKSVRELFVKSEHVFLQKKTPEDDAYGFGRTIQYFLAKCRTETELTRYERKTLKHVVEKCTQGQEMTVTMLRDLREDVRRCIPSEKTNRRRIIARRILGGTFILGVSVAIAFGMFRKSVVEKRSEDQTGAEKQIERTVDESGKEDSADKEGETDEKVEVRREEYVNGCIEAGLLYTYQMEQTGLGRYYLSLVEEDSVLAKCYLQINEFVQGQDVEEDESAEGEEDSPTESDKGEEVEIVQAIRTGIIELEEMESLDDIQTYLYYLPVLKVYAIRQEKEDAAEEIRICKKILRNMGIQTTENGEPTVEELSDTEKELSQSIDRELEIRGYLADASERAGDLEQTIQEYRKIKELMKSMDDKDMDELEMIYSKLTEVYEEKDLREEMWANCREAVETIPQSQVLWIQFIRLRCSDEGLERAVCAETVKEAVKSVPELIDNQEFQKLQKEYAIRIEGEQVWVGQ